jgi:hypothetical protein
MQMDHLTFDGFGAGETDFATRFDASPVELREAHASEAESALARV